MQVFEEILWPQFVQIEKIKRLPLHEQVEAYDQYLSELSLARINWLSAQHKGPVYTNDENFFDFLLDEDGFFLLLEDGGKIIIGMDPG